MQIKTSGWMVLSCALALSSATFAQDAPATAVESTTTTTTTTTDVAPVVEGETVVQETAVTETTLPATGGAPLLMALAGALTAGGALFGLKKVR